MMERTGGRLLGLLAGLFYLAGAADYVMVRYGVDAYMRLISPDQAAWVTGLPVWVTVLWAVAVWGGLLAALLTLMQAGGEVLTFAIAAIAACAAAAYAILFARPPLAEVGGQNAVWLMAGTAALAVVFWLWARARRARARRRPAGMR